MSFAPIVIIGVPRSGTTLLRVLLDSHTQIMALPETPWLLGAYGKEPSLRELLEGLIEGAFGLRNVAGAENNDVLAAGSHFLEKMFEPVLAKRTKRLVAFKTPADIRHLSFLTKLLPQASYIHITRDGRDVVRSQLAKKGTFFNDLKEYKRVTYANVFRRWVEWEQSIRATLYRENIRVIHLRYEDLIADPRRELQRITDFLGLSFEPAMLNFAAVDHDLPTWEAGSTDVARTGGIKADAAGKWRAQPLTSEMLYTLRRYEPYLRELGYPPNDLAPSQTARISASLFPIMRPFLDAASIVRERWLRPFVKNRARLAATLGVLALCAQFLVPTEISGVSGVAQDAYQPFFCLLAMFGFGAAFGAAFDRRFSAVQAFVVPATCALLLLGLLEYAQGFSAGREPSLSDFGLNTLGALAGLLAAKLFSRGGGTVRDIATSRAPRPAGN